MRIKTKKLHKILTENRMQKIITKLPDDKLIQAYHRSQNDVKNKKSGSDIVQGWIVEELENRGIDVSNL